MAVYKQRKSQFYWYSVYVPGSKQRLRGSTGTTDLEKAKAVEATMILAAGRKSPADRLIDMIKALSQKTETTPAICRLVETYDQIAETVGTRIGARTVYTRRQVLARFATWVAKSYPSCKFIGDVGKDCAAAFASSISALSAKTRQNIIGELTSSWNILARGIELAGNPWPQLSPVNVRSERYKTFTVDQAKRIIQEADKDSLGEWGIACRIALATGLRFGDVVNLRSDDITDGVITLTPHKTKDSSGVNVCIPLPEEVASMIPDRPGLLMPRLSRQQLNKSKQPEGHEFSRILKAAGIEGKGYTFHSFRHTFRTRLADCGVNQATAMALGGWTDEATAKRYDHSTHVEEYRAAIETAWRMPSAEKPPSESVR